MTMTARSWWAVLCSFWVLSILCWSNLLAQDKADQKIVKALPAGVPVTATKLSCRAIGLSVFSEPAEDFWKESRAPMIEGTLTDGRDVVTIELKGKTLSLTTQAGMEAVARLRQQGLPVPEDDPYLVLSHTGNYIVGILTQEFPAVLDSVVIDRRSGYTVWTQTIAMLDRDIPYTQTYYLACR